jgi:hypothetical protein
LKQVEYPLSLSLLWGEGSCDDDFSRCVCH